MKYRSIISLIMLTGILMATTSCKKTFSYTKAGLIGKWTETPPYLSNNGPYMLQFDTNNVVIETSPYLITGNYIFLGNNNIQLDCSIPEGPACIGLASYTYHLNGDAVNMTIEKYLTGASTSGSGTSYDLHLKKTN